jgi:hypothetical protein
VLAASLLSDGTGAAEDVFMKYAETLDPLDIKVCAHG